MLCVFIKGKTHMSSLYDLLPFLTNVETQISIYSSQHKIRKFKEKYLLLNLIHNLTWKSIMKTYFYNL